MGRFRDPVQLFTAKNLPGLKLRYTYKISTHGQFRTKPSLEFSTTNLWLERVTVTKNLIYFNDLSVHSSNT
jgi:hypothetical protein